MTRRSVAVTVVAFVSVLAGVVAGLAVNTAVLAQSSGGPSGDRDLMLKVLSRTTGRYAAPGGGGKSDSAQMLRPPVNPTASDVHNWVNAHNAGLLGGIRGRFRDPEIDRFLAAERTKCSGNIYCEMTFRQQAIAVLLAERG